MAKSKGFKIALKEAGSADGIIKTPFALGVFAFALLMIGLVFAAVYYHFFMRGDIPWVKMGNQESAQYWGQLGDFAGGMLNPILSFLALMAVLKTLAMQRAEMRAAQEEARAATLEQKIQSNLYTRQAFESSFFGMLDVHSRILSDIRYRASTGRPTSGREAVDTMIAELKASTAFKAATLYSGSISEAEIQIEIDNFCTRYKAEVGHYFRNLYWILKKIDGGRLGLDSEEKYERSHDRRFFFDYLRRRQYASLVRAQLSEGELALLQLNCLGAYGGGLKKYVEKYSLLKSLEPGFFGSWAPYINGQFHGLAVKSSSQVKLSDLQDLFESQMSFKRLRAKAGAVDPRA